MTGTGDWTPPPPPGTPPPPPSAPPPGPPPPGTPPYAGGWGAPPYVAPPRTNPLAIVSLVAGCAQFAFCFLASIVAIVTGHIARAQIKRTNEQGAGLALTGLILGYIGLAITVLGIAAFATFVFAFSGDVAQNSVRDDARDFGRAIVRQAVLTETTPRDPTLLRLVYTEQHGLSSGCCEDDHIQLADGTPVEAATAADWERVRWRLEFSQTILYTRHACLTVPSEVTEIPVVVEGRCLGVP